MKRAVRTAAVAVALVPLVLWSLHDLRAQPFAGAAQNPAAGSRVFGSKGCATCHAVNGVGGKVGPDLGRITRPRSLYDLAAAMWNHLPRMLDRMRQLGVPRPRLDPQEAGDLVAFLFTLDYFDRPGDALAGRRLFTSKRCVLCHQAGGVGGVVGPNLDFLSESRSPIFVATAMWNHAPAMAEAMRARGVERPVFDGRELRDLIAYLRSTAPEPPEGPLYVLPGRADEGRRLFAEKRCIECHNVRGEGGRLGPDLAERGRHLSLIEFAAAMWNKAPAMLEATKARGIALPQVRPEEMADLVAYLYAVNYFGEPGDPQRGRALVAARGCLACHSAGGRGGRVAGDLGRVKGLDSPAAVISAMWNHAFVLQDRAQRGGAAWPRLSAREMADVTAFLQAAGDAR